MLFPTAVAVVLFWLGALIFFCVLEACTAGLCSIWFAAGAFFALTAAILGAAFPIQVLVFIVVSGVTVVFTRPLVKKYLNTKKVPTNVDSVIDQVCAVTERIDNIAGTGTVKLGAVLWTARSVSGTVIDEGELVRVQSVSGAKLIVEPAAVTAQAGV